MLMPGTLVLKRLTASDLTLFDYQFRHHPAGKQKAINLDRRILVDEVYPALRSPVSPQRFPVDLYLYGPGLKEEYNLQRKILKQQKNWRLDGELVPNPDSDPVRFDNLHPGDLSVLEFNEGLYPDTLRIAFVSQHDSDDVRLHSSLNAVLGTSNTIVLSTTALEDVVTHSGASQLHPIQSFLLDADFEDIALGGSQARERLISRPSRRRMSRDDVHRMREATDRIGLSGEQFVNDYLLQLKDEGVINDFEWISSENAISPYDFRVSHDGNHWVLIDVKSTAGSFERMVHISFSELRQMSIGAERYDIFRVYDIEEDTAQLRIAEDVRDFATSILNTLGGLPAGVSTDSISFAPAHSGLLFGQAKTITLLDTIDDT
jgi:hypothetical protein